MIRKILKIGNSEEVTIPASVMRAYKLSAGKKIEILIGKPGSELRRLELLRDLEELTKRHPKNLKTPGE